MRRLEDIDEEAVLSHCRGWLFGARADADWFQLHGALVNALPSPSNLFVLCRQVDTNTRRVLHSGSINRVYRSPESQIPQRRGRIPHAQELIHPGVSNMAAAVSGIPQIDDWRVGVHVSLVSMTAPQRLDHQHKGEEGIHGMVPCMGWDGTGGGEGRGEERIRSGRSGSKVVQRMGPGRGTVLLRHFDGIGV